MAQRTYTFYISNAVEIWYVPSFKPFGISADIRFSTYRVICMTTITPPTIQPRPPTAAAGTNPIMQRINYTYRVFTAKNIALNIWWVPYCTRFIPLYSVSIVPLTNNIPPPTASPCPRLGESNPSQQHGFTGVRPRTIILQTDSARYVEWSS